MNIGIYIYSEAEVLDFSGPFEVLTTANRVLGENVFNVSLISELGGVVDARAGYQVVSNHSIHNHPKLDVLIVVGGYHLDEMNKQEVIDWIALQNQSTQMTASVCTGAFLLARAGVITQEEVTTHWEDVSDLKEMFPKLSVKEDVRWVDQGRIVTSGGISAGIDMSLHLVSRLHSLELAEKTAKQMEFDWTKA